ncbi:MAG TPA: hypothetical protein VEA17_14445 [Bordetella sp.]|nr:hypothetical protein [Bordetella sp.]
MLTSLSSRATHAQSLALVKGSFDNHRRVSIPGVNETLDSGSLLSQSANVRLGYYF